MYVPPTHQQMRIAGAYWRALAGRDPTTVDQSDLLAAIATEVPGVTLADLNDALRAEINRMHRMLEMHLLNAPVSARPN